MNDDRNDEDHHVSNDVDDAHGDHDFENIDVIGLLIGNPLKAFMSRLDLLL